MKSSNYSAIIDGERYNALMKQHLYIAEADAVIKALIQREIRVIGNAEIVEIGCGPARVTGFIQEIIPNPITGIDIDEGFLLYARQHAKSSRFINIPVQTYRHAKPLDIFYSQGVHHHISKGVKTEQYLQNVYAQLRDGGCYILSDEFLPKYQNEEERQRKAVVWYSHVIASAIKSGYRELAEEEAKTLADDLREGDKTIGEKTQGAIAYTLKAALSLEEARMKRKNRRRTVKNYLEAMHTKEQPNTISTSRQDYKICEAVLLKELEETDFRIEIKARIGPPQDIGAMHVYVLRK